MADDNLNLALDVTSDDDTPVVRVFLEMACSYTRSQGAPTLTRDCRTVDELEQEISRLKSECDALLEEAKPQLGAGSPTKPSARPPEPAPGVETVGIDHALTVADVMTRSVKTMRRNDRVSVADELMKVGRFRHVVVLDDDEREVVGVVSHRDIFYGAIAWSTGLGGNAREKALRAVAIKDVMRADVVTVPPDTPLAEAASRMLEHKIGCLPVIQEGRLVGIVTEGDFLSLLTHARYGPEECGPEDGGPASGR